MAIDHRHVSRILQIVGIAAAPTKLLDLDADLHREIVERALVTIVVRRRLSPLLILMPSKVAQL